MRGCGGCADLNELPYHEGLHTQEVYDIPEVTSTKLKPRTYKCSWKLAGPSCLTLFTGPPENEDWASLTSKHPLRFGKRLGTPFGF